MLEHTIVISFSVEGEDRSTAQARLMAALLGADTIDPQRETNGITCWWEAEDDRIDGSDCDSAVFVHPGLQETASRLLFGLGWTSYCNVVERDVRAQFDGTPV